IFVSLIAPVLEPSCLRRPPKAYLHLSISRQLRGSTALLSVPWQTCRPAPPPAQSTAHSLVCRLHQEPRASRPEAVVNQTVDQAYLAGVGRPYELPSKLMHAPVHESLVGHHFRRHFQTLLLHWFHSSRKRVKDDVAHLHVFTLHPRRSKMNDPSYVRHFREIWRSHEAIAEILMQYFSR